MLDPVVAERPVEALGVIPIDPDYRVRYSEGMSTMLPPIQFFSTQEAAVAIGVTDGRVRQMLRAGEICGQKLGRHAWAIPSTEIDRAKQDRAQAVESHSPAN
jgi:excisionase family DNA binding protein